MNGASSIGSGQGNPVDKFEEAFQTCLTALTKEDPLTNVDKDEIRVDVDECINNLVECARMMEGYFLRKRLHIAAQKPELLVKDDANELRYEVVRKEDLVKKNCEKIAHWQTILADLQSNTTVSGKPTTLPINTMPSLPSSQGSPNPVGRPSLGRSTPTSIGPGLQGRLQSPMGLGFPSPVMSQQQPPKLEGPLAFLERTASTIGMNENR